MSRAFLEVRGVEVEYRGPGKTRIHAVRGVDLDLARGEALGLVGESGCGKSTLARAILRLVDPARGTIRLDGIDLTALGERAVRPLRRRMQLVFQDSSTALNPRMTVERAIGEVIRFHGREGNGGLDRAIDRTLALTGLPPDVRRRWPHELSGGQRQRVSIARALAVEPELLVADEPVSSLDVSVKAQILNLFLDLRARLGLSLLLVSHELDVVRHVADRVAVMYLGRIVEVLPTAGLDTQALHPYTRALLASAPSADPRRRGAAKPLEGDAPSPANVPPGCAFAPRCPIAETSCTGALPQLEPALERGHLVACPIVLRPVDRQAGG